MTNGFLEELLNEKAVKGNDTCRDNALMIGESLIYSFGIDMKNPQAPANENAGLTHAKNFLKQVCTQFADPTHIVRVAPFANAYLGTEVFNQALNVTLDRAKEHPEEQTFLDDVLTGAALIAPEKRNDFLESVRNAQDISDEMFGLGMLITDADPTASFSTPDEFPQQFRTHDVSRATSLIGRFVELGLFVPGKGFTPKYEKLASRMGGFDYLVRDPSPDHAILVSNADFSKVTNGLKLRIENTPEYDQRPNNSNENPGIVILNNPDNPLEVQKLYPRSTLFYVARNAKEKRTIEKALGEKSGLVVDGTANDIGKLLRATVQFVDEGKRNGMLYLNEMLEAGITEAKKLVETGNEYFYEIRDKFEDMGKRQLIDEMVAATGRKLPKRTNNKLVMLLSPAEGELLPYFEETTSKRVQHYKTLPDAEETGIPFVVITNQPIKEEEIHKKLPSATVLYFARNSKEESAILSENGHETFVVNADVMKKFGKYRANHDIGYNVTQMFFNPIAESRGKGVTTMNGIVEGISRRIKGVKDKIVFSTRLEDYYQTAREYWGLQEQYRGVPLVAQQMDGVLMQTCPTGGCLKMTNEPYGGCGANYGQVLIDFAADYRRQVGEDNFISELTKFHGGKPKDPWYTHEYRYERQFPKGIKKQNKFKMTF